MATIAADQLVSTIYVSSGVRLFDDADVAAMLTQARRNNERCGVTGMLVYRDGNFLQVLEGPSAAVASTLERIHRDERHRGIVVMRKAPIESRGFAEWTMAFRQIGSEELPSMTGYSPFMELSFNSQAFQDCPDLAYRLLLKFKANIR